MSEALMRWHVRSGGDQRYLVHVGPDDDVEVTLHVRHPYLPRIDYIVRRGASEIVAVLGTPAVHPCPPTVPAGMVVLAEVRVPPAESPYKPVLIDRRRWGWPPPSSDDRVPPIPPSVAFIRDLDTGKMWRRDPAGTWVEQPASSVIVLASRDRQPG
jgi:hypothetical protein